MLQVQAVGASLGGVLLPLDVHLDCIGHGRGVGDQPRSEGVVLPAQHLANGLGTDSPVRTLDHLAHLEGRDDDVTEAGG